MTKVTHIDNRCSAVSWSPIGSCTDLIALGSKDSGGAGFDDYGGELELFNLRITSPEMNSKPAIVGCVKTTSRFSSIGWTSGTETLSSSFGMGLIAGGMADGTVNIWNPMKIKDSDDNALLSSISCHNNGAISALEFNPHPGSANVLATGGSNGEVFVLSLDKPDQPTVTVPAPDQPNQGAEITQVSWNSQVKHIIASSSGNGTAVVWDLRQQKLWCELRCESAGCSVTDLCWNPSQGLHIITASSDDRNPVLKLWDLRASTATPLATLEGHNNGVLSIAWCPHDDSLLLSCGKDNRTLLWDLFSLKPIAEIPNDEIFYQDARSDVPLSSHYGDGLTCSKQKRYDVQWSPLRRGVISTCSFDRKVQIHSVIGVATKCGRPPKWMKPVSGVSCGVGGTVISFGSPKSIVTISSFVERPDLKYTSIKFEKSIASSDYSGYCSSKAESTANSGDVYDSQIWGFMQVLFEENSREQLLHYLGFDRNLIHRVAMDFNVSVSDESEEFLEKVTNPSMRIKAENSVNQALLVGNFEAAVQCSFRSGNYGDALILASCGGADLWAKTQAQYFANEASKRPYLSIVSAVIHNKLKSFIASSNPSHWHETLAVLCTYGQPEEFPFLCQALGDHLLSANDLPNASLCYMCAFNLEKASQYWIKQLEEVFNIDERVGFLALHTFVEKVSVFMKALEPNYSLQDKVSDLFFQYAKVLADQGLFSTAAKYCRSNSQECKELRDRLYRSKDSHLCALAFGSPPEFPFHFCNVGVTPSSSTVPQVYTNTITYSTQDNNKLDVTNNIQQCINRTYDNGYNYNIVQQRIPDAHKDLNIHANLGDCTDHLPPGWVTFHDPSSGKIYYANQSTGETTWDMPSSVLSKVSPTTNHYFKNSETGTSHAHLQYRQSDSHNVLTDDKSRTQVNLASKYGDGFVTSASHPELGEQYGNIGTSNPYPDSRPGTAVVRKDEKSLTTDKLDINMAAEVSDEYKQTIDGLLGFVIHLSNQSLTGSEKKQFLEIEKGVARFIQRLNRKEIEAEVVCKVENMVIAIKKSDFSLATSIQTSLVNSDWKKHKDWLKSKKFLIQLMSRKKL